MQDALPARAKAQDAIERLAGRFGTRLQTGRDIRAQHAHTTSWHPSQPPDAVVFPETTDEVAEIVRIAGETGTPLIPFGTGTSLEGHVNAPRGGVSVDLSRMNRVLAIHDEDFDVVVQPGVTRRALDEALRHTGLFFPVDPGADASLGGMASTRASGTNAVRYGTMRENVLALECVMPDGRIIRTGRRARKSAAGYDLARLLVGAEGTLGIITELTLRLFGRPETMTAARAMFPSVDAACAAVIETMQTGVPVARIELLDAVTVAALNAYSGLALPEAPLLLLEFHGSRASAEEDAARFAEIAASHGSDEIVRAENEEARRSLWRARHDAYWALRALEPGSETLATDVCVPISNLAEAVGRAVAKARELGLRAPIAGHVGDGNFHAILFTGDGTDGRRERAEEYVAWLSDMAVSLDGTCTGEHGVGQGKRASVARELGPAIDVMRTIKSALDPKGIMNPGKIV